MPLDCLLRKMEWQGENDERTGSERRVKREKRVIVTVETCQEAPFSTRRDKNPIANGIVSPGNNNNNKTTITATTTTTTTSSTDCND